MSENRSRWFVTVWVVLGLVLAACTPSPSSNQAPSTGSGPAAAPAKEAPKAAAPVTASDQSQPKSEPAAAQPAKPAWQVEWDKTVEAAKKESLIITSDRKSVV